MAFLDRRALMGLMAGAALLLAAGTAAAANLAEQMTLGNPKARVEVIEYASASCPHCARFDLQVFPAFKKKYIDTGKVHFIFREVLTPPVELAGAGFLIARCVSSDKYFTTLDAIFHSQAEWKEGADIRAVMLGVAKNAGLTEAQFEACLSDPAAQKALNDRVEKLTAQDKVEATPTFFVNGKRLTPGMTEIDLAALDALVGPALAARPAAAGGRPRH